MKDRNRTEILRNVYVPAVEGRAMLWVAKIKAAYEAVHP